MLIDLLSHSPGQVSQTSLFSTTSNLVHPPFSQQEILQCTSEQTEAINGTDFHFPPTSSPTLFSFSLGTTEGDNYLMPNPFAYVLEPTHPRYLELSLLLFSLPPTNISNLFFSTCLIKSFTSFKKKKTFINPMSSPATVVENSQNRSNEKPSSN